MLVCLYAAGSEESQLGHLLQMHTQRYSKCFHCLFVQGFVQHIAERMHSWDFRMHMLKLLTLFKASAHSWVMQLSSAILVQLDWSPCLTHFATMRDRACSVQLVFPIFLYFRSICQTNSHPFCDLWQRLVQSSTFRFRLVNSSGPLTVSSGMVHGTRLRPVVEVSGHVRGQLSKHATWCAKSLKQHDTRWDREMMPQCYAVCLSFQWTWASHHCVTFIFSISFCLMDSWKQCYCCYWTVSVFSMIGGWGGLVHDACSTPSRGRDMHAAMAWARRA